MQFKRSELDAVSHAYLRRAETLSGRAEEELPGVFVPTSHGWFADPRRGWAGLLFWGAVLLLLAAWLALAAANGPRAKLPNFGGATAAATALGLLCVTAGVVRFRRAEPDGPVGDFVFADSSRLWVVEGSNVKVCEYADDVAATGQHFFHRGAYRDTAIIVRSSAGLQYLRATHRSGAERLLRFLNAVGHLRQLEEPTFRNLAGMGSARVGLVALCVLDDRSLDRVSFDSVTDSPRPSADPTGDGPPDWAGAVGRALAAGALGLWLFFSLPPAFDSLREAKLFAAVRAEPPVTVLEMDRYLAEYPGDYRGPTVRQMRDDRVFGLISRPIKGAPYELFAIDRYLTEYPDGRHANEAQELKASYFLAVAQRNKRDAENPDRATTSDRPVPPGRTPPAVPTWPFNPEPRKPGFDPPGATPPSGAPKFDPKTGPLEFDR